MLISVSLFVRNHLFDLCDVGHVNNGSLTKISLALGRFLIKNVRLISVCAFYFSELGKLKTLFGTAVCFDLRH